MDTDRLTLLREARDLIVQAMTSEHTCPSCDAVLDVDSAQLPALVRELRAVLGEIDTIPGSGEVSDLDRLADDLEERRRKRQAG